MNQVMKNFEFIDVKRFKSLIYLVVDLELNDVILNEKK